MNQNKLVFCQIMQLVCDNVFFDDCKKRGWSAPVYLSHTKK